MFPIDANFITAQDIHLHERNECSHKGNFGHALLAAGSEGKMGAAVLAARACIRAGCGLVTAHIPRGGNVIMQIAAPEIMTDIDDCETYISHISSLEAYTALGIGPGAGTQPETAAVVEAVLRSGKPAVIDADALNCIAAHKDLLALLHENCILTPHPGEFDRLTHAHETTVERFETQKNFAQYYNCTILLKGRYTCVCTPQSEVFFNSSGNAGMATAGSGDVLTGIILSLLAQTYSITQSAVYGAFLHGLSGDCAKIAVGEESLTAQSLVDFLPQAFLQIHNQ
ncbi:MAG: NAD(P)H-hydrate dehydratase [Bacteroidales bacterium]|jgi:NAD(P)H-hydrate epimerase|nr:NAD(P)H-hydrate dehydratase [Bacteroidales bacterium]